MPRTRKIYICRAVVNSNIYKSEFKRFYPELKFDDRKEVQNLHKLVTEKRHRSKLLSNKWREVTETKKELWKDWEGNSVMPLSLIKDMEKL